MDKYSTFLTILLVLINHSSSTWLGDDQLSSALETMGVDPAELVRIETDLASPIALKTKLARIELKRKEFMLEADDQLVIIYQTNKIWEKPDPNMPNPSLGVSLGCFYAVLSKTQSVEGANVLTLITSTTPNTGADPTQVKTNYDREFLQIRVKVLETAPWKKDGMRIVLQNVFENPSGHIYKCLEVPSGGSNTKPMYFFASINTNTYTPTVMRVGSLREYKQVAILELSYLGPSVTHLEYDLVWLKSKPPKEAWPKDWAKYEAKLKSEYFSDIPPHSDYMLGNRLIQTNTLQCNEMAAVKMKSSSEILFYCGIATAELALNAEVKHFYFILESKEVAILDFSRIGAKTPVVAGDELSARLVEIFSQ